MVSYISRIHTLYLLAVLYFGEKGGKQMAVEKVGEKYRCNVCGNEVVVTEVGGGTLVCCGQDMERMELKTPEVINLPDSGG
jgi:desulfoferrodoxin-like iron-binding protein